MKYICIQPRLKYFAWQVEVMLKSFLENGVHGNDIEILVAYNKADATSNEENIRVWDTLRNHYNYVRFFYYEDERKDTCYIPSVYFNIIKQHYRIFPNLEKEIVLCHDCDITLTRPLNLSSMLNDNIWYLSDTVGYIGYQYIITKGEDVYKQMCEIVGIDPLIPKLMNSNSGGAQYLIKNATYEYWDKVERDALKLYKHFNATEKECKQDTPIQKWTAGMWSMLWNAWLLGHETKVHKDLDFCWATDSVNRWDECPIFHNAGVMEHGELFLKSNYINTLPYNIQNTFDKNRCSHRYVEQIIRTGETSPINF